MQSIAIDGLILLFVCMGAAVVVSIFRDWLDAREVRRQRQVKPEEPNDQRFIFGRHHFIEYQGSDWEISSYLGCLQSNADCFCCDNEENAMALMNKMDAAYDATWS